MSKIWCMGCKKELEGGESVNLGLFGLPSSGSIYCKNEKCKRYGLVTVIYLKEQTEAPEDAVSSDPVGGV